MAALNAARAGFASHWAALLVAVAFAIVQAPTLDYGTRINDLPHIRNYQIAGNVVGGSGLERRNLIGSETGRTESLDLWMVRFKLYTVDADEVDSIIALARIRPAELQFDPHYYQYGGAFLYPLGAYYYALSKLGVLSIGPLEQMLDNPNRIDRVWIAGRALVLLVAALSGLVLYFALAQFAPKHVALAGLVIYLFCPATIMFSQVLKPHWYALLFANVVVLIVVRALAKGQLTRVGEFGLGIALGLMVGSVLTYSLFAILVWGALVFHVWREQGRMVLLVRIPIIAIVTFVAVNPYFVLDWQGVQIERAAQVNWFTPALHLETVPLFFVNTILPGFGLVLTMVFIAVFIRHLMRPAPMGVRLLGIAILIPIVVMAALTSSHSEWHSNFRYLPYVLPSMIVFLSMEPWPYRKIILTLTAAASIIQAIPMKLAYFDENSDAHSTRLSSAAWIDANVPVDDPICLSTATLAPYSVPPFRFDRYKLNSPDCKWMVVLDGNATSTPVLPGWTLAREFRARLSPARFPLVWEHINPPIVIYRKAG